LRTGAFGQALLYSAQAAVFWQTEPRSTARVLGGSGDTFVVEDTRNGTALRLEGGKGGANTLDYRPYPGGKVLVNLQTGTATGFTGGIANIQNVFGGPAGSYNILVGNGGNVLTGGNGRRNLLIAGTARSTLIGGDGEDILIGGTTDYDTNLAALQDIMSVWTGPGLYQDRVTALTNDPLYAFPLTGGTGGPLGTVHSNGGGNTLIGKPGGSTALDLYFGDATLDANDSTEADAFITIV
jgi:Ca2+-binding RTX toxin-like protein